MRFGLIGYGLWGRHHARAIQGAPGAVLAAIACRSGATAAAARADFPGVPVHVGYRELLARADVDAVAIVVPNDLHAEIATAALEQGKDVLLEKPLAPTLAACDALIDAERRSGRVLTVGHELRLSTQWGRIKTLIDAGDIGEPMAVVMNLFRFPYRRGSEGWRHEPDRIGSWIMEELVHHFDLALWYFARFGPPASVVAAGNGRHGVSAMTENFAGVVRFAGDRYAVVTQTLAGFDYDLVVEVTGTAGAIRASWLGALDRTRQAAFELKVLRGGASAPESLPVAASGELYELEEQVRQVVTAFRERRPLVSAGEARRPVAVCLAAEQSLREGREIALRW
ncbi:MAG: Gfo/Idh/MocA family oxidoreductase [Candidatus Rokubacteria bacterium]|nr:Gfo/Idh/MocA family oxidoreductase [Candidatus Rokubacteria bacterium]